MLQQQKQNRGKEFHKSDSLAFVSTAHHSVLFIAMFVTVFCCCCCYWYRPAFKVLVIVAKMRTNRVAQFREEKKKGKVLYCSSHWMWTTQKVRFTRISFSVWYYTTKMCGIVCENILPTWNISNSGTIWITSKSFRAFDRNNRMTINCAQLLVHGRNWTYLTMLKIENIIYSWKHVDDSFAHLKN